MPPAMRACVAAIIVLLFPLTVIAHPGKTDRRGGHRCWRDCVSWGLLYSEYHLHDKYFMPVRLDKPAGVKIPETSAKPSAILPDLEGTPEKTPEPAMQALPEAPRSPHVPAPVSVPAYIEESLFPWNPYQVVLLLVLLILLLALLVMRRKREGR